MIVRGDCLSCVKLGSCQIPSVRNVLDGYTCVLFEPAQEPVTMARWNMMMQVGEETAVRAMLAHNTRTEDTDE